MATDEEDLVRARENLQSVLGPKFAEFATL
jgi:hypothetical protein